MINRVRAITRLQSMQFSANLMPKLYEVEPEQKLSFVKKSSGLMQLKCRFPNDGLFPPIKAVEDMIPSDVPGLIKQKRFDTLYELIQH